MVYDDIVVGSGLAGLGVVLGLPPERNVLVLGGPEAGRFSYYRADAAVPCAYLGFGGLGNYWHGVIPTALRPSFGQLTDESFARLFEWFYPKTSLERRLGAPWLFVPHRPIRPAGSWRKLTAARRGRLDLRHEVARSFHIDGDSVSVVTDQGEVSAARLWIAAGTLHTPGLLNASLPGFQGVRSNVSDHVIAYMGQIDRTRHPTVQAPRIDRTAEGFWVPANYNHDNSGLFTAKPAHFSYRVLDHGIEQRTAFGLPTGGAVAKVIRAASAGLICEALYNKFGLLQDSDRLNVYAQVKVDDAYTFAPGPALIERTEVIRRATDRTRADTVWRDVITPSRRPELFITGIHLHHSVDAAALLERGINRPESVAKVVDASAVETIGAEHHSFKIMAAAYAAARQS